MVHKEREIFPPPVRRRVNGGGSPLFGGRCPRWGRTVAKPRELSRAKPLASPLLAACKHCAGTMPVVCRGIVCPCRGNAGCGVRHLRGHKKAHSVVGSSCSKRVKLVSAAAKFFLRPFCQSKHGAVRRGANFWRFFRPRRYFPPISPYLLPQTGGEKPKRLSLGSQSATLT